MRIDDLRIDNPTVAELTALAAERPSKETVIQFNDSSAYGATLLALVDVCCRRMGPAFTVRFYGQQLFDADVLRALPSCRSLLLDCHWEMANTAAIADLPCLERLVVQVHEGRHDAILRLPNLHRLRALTIGDSHRKDWDLSPLPAFTELRELTVAGQHKNIVVLGELAHLESLSLRSIPRAASLAFIGRMTGLQSLAFLLGSRDDLDDAAHPSLKALEVVRIRGLARLDVQQFPALETLRVEDEARVVSLDLSASSALRSAIVSNCKAMAAVNVDGAEQLERLMLHTTAVDPEAFLSQALPASLSVLDLCGYGRQRDAAISSQLRGLGYRSAWPDGPHEPS